MGMGHKKYRIGELNLFWQLNLSNIFNLPNLSYHKRASDNMTTKDKLTELIERTFQREGSLYLACNERNAFLLRKNLKNITHGLVKMYVGCGFIPVLL